MIATGLAGALHFAAIVVSPLVRVGAGGRAGPSDGVGRSGRPVARADGVAGADADLIGRTVGQAGDRIAGAGGDAGPLEADGASGDRQLLRAVGPEVGVRRRRGDRAGAADRGVRVEVEAEQLRTVVVHRLSDRLGVGVADVEGPGRGGHGAHMHLERAERLADLVDACVVVDRLVGHREAKSDSACRSRAGRSGSSCHWW